MKRVTLVLIATVSLVAPSSLHAQSVSLQAKNALMPMPGESLPKMPIPAPIPLPNMPNMPSRPFPIPTLPGPLPPNFEYIPVRLEAAQALPVAAARPVAAAAAAQASRQVASARMPAQARATATVGTLRASDLQKTLESLRETFGLDEDGQPKNGGKADGTGGSFDGKGERGRSNIPEADLEKDIGVHRAK